MHELTPPLLSFTVDFDERTAYEVVQKGWFGGAVVTLPTGQRIPLSFWDPIRLVQDASADFSAGRACFAEPVLIIVPTITRESMEKAVEELYRSGYFNHLLELHSASPEL